MGATARRKMVSEWFGRRGDSGGGGMPRRIGEDTLCGGYDGGRINQMGGMGRSSVYKTMGLDDEEVAEETRKDSRFRGDNRPRDDGRFCDDGRDRDDSPS